MKILLQQSGHSFSNVGDLAMLQVACDRFRRRWPHCHITVLSEPKLDAGLFVDGVVSIDRNTVGMAFGSGCLFGRFSRFVRGADTSLLIRHPSLVRGAALKQRLKGRSPDSLERFIRLLVEADLVASSGGGFLFDEFPSMVEWTAYLLLAAQRLGKRTALFGQGIGPLHDRRLRKLLKRTLREIDIVGLREGVYGPAILEELGCDHSKCVVTGDDALEPAYLATSSQLGTRLGVNLRRSYYAGISDKIESRITEVVGKLLAKLGTAPVTIAIASNHFDASVSARVVGRSTSQNEPLKMFDVIREVGKCRVVLTGSYHAGVFALAQGIPVVGIAGVDYYRQKFIGLAAQFPKGCLIADTLSPTFEADIMRHVSFLWQRVEDLRGHLLSLAKTQIDVSRCVYDTYMDRVDDSKSVSRRRYFQ